VTTSLYHCSSSAVVSINGPRTRSRYVRFVGRESFQPEPRSERPTSCRCSSLARLVHRRSLAEDSVLNHGFVDGNKRTAMYVVAAIGVTARRH
jgi:hypothetical protein